MLESFATGEELIFDTDLFKLEGKNITPSAVNSELWHRIWDFFGQHCDETGFDERHHGGRLGAIFKCGG